MPDMVRRYIIIILVLLPLSLNAQRTQLTVVTDKGVNYLPAYERQGTIYFSIKHLAESLNIPYYFDNKSGKIEIRFPYQHLRFTHRNPVIVIINAADRQSKVHQLPTSTYLIDNEIYVPLVYTASVIEGAYRRTFVIESKEKVRIKESPPIAEVKEELKKEVKEIKEPLPPPKRDYDITGITIDEKANGTLVRVHSKKNIASYNSSFKDGKLSIVFRNVSVDTASIESARPEGIIKNVLASNAGKDAVFNFTLTGEYTTSEVLNADGSNDILITIHNKIFVRDETRDRIRSKWSFDVVVLDAGHGGKDPGAIGVNGVKEKDVNLAITLKLGNLIEKNMPDVKVVYTRKTDTFVELYKRGKIANDHNGKLFVSIHCNSMPKKPSDANGFEVYLLRPGRTQEAIAIAERENSVIQYEDDPQRYQLLTDENFILVSMAHSAYMKYSERFADLLNRQFKDDLELTSRGIKQAGFYVLVGASMPSVLIEAGFLSNSRDAKYLASKRGQEKIAASIFEAIKKYKQHYEREMDSG